MTKEKQEELERLECIMDEYNFQIRDTECQLKELKIGKERLSQRIEKLQKETEHD